MEWKYKKLSEFAEVSSGGTPKKSNKDFWDGDIPWYSSGELNDFNTVAPKAYITESGLLGSNAKLFPKGSLLIGMYDTAALKMSIIDREGTFNQAIAGVKPNDDVDLSFILYAINSIKPELLKLRRGVRQKNLNQGMIKDILIPDIPLPEQKRIVALLDTVFADLEQTRAKTEKNLKNARELFDSYLQQVCIGNEMDWKKCQVGDVCDLWQGLAINKKTKHLLVEKSSLPLLRIKDLKYKTSEQYVAEEGFPTKALVNEDEVIYTRTGQVGLVFRGFKGVLHNNSFKVSPNDQIEKSYLFWWLQHSSFKNEIMKLSSKAAQPDISHASFKKQPISIPPVSYQLSSAIQIEKMSKLSLEVEAIYKKKLSALDELKKSILQKAFRGELTHK